MKRFLVVDDHTMVRQGLMNLLNGIPDLAISCDGADSAKEALERSRLQTYDLIILDISLPDMSGLELLPQLKQSAPATPVLILSMFPEEQFALRALRLGAAGYLTKQQAADELIHAIHKVLSGERYLSESFSNTLISNLLAEPDQGAPRHNKLSNREFEILRRLATGQSLKQIADELGVSIKTVSTYKTRLCAKMKFRNNTEMVTYAIEQKLC